MRSSVLGAFVAAVLLLDTSPLRATIVVPMSFDELVTQADAIVHGRVQDVRSQWADGKRFIETLVTVVIADTFKGAERHVMTFKTAGGEAGRLRSIVPGAPVFREGDEVVLFVAGDAPALPVIVGFNQGVLRVARDAVTGRALVAPGLILRSSDSTQRIVRGASQRVSLEDLRQQIADVLNGVTGTPRRER